MTNVSDILMDWNVAIRRLEVYGEYIRRKDWDSDKYLTKEPEGVFFYLWLCSSVSKEKYQLTQEDESAKDWEVYEGEDYHKIEECIPASKLVSIQKKSEEYNLERKRHFTESYLRHRYPADFKSEQKKKIEDFYDNAVSFEKAQRLPASERLMFMVIDQEEYMDGWNIFREGRVIDILIGDEIIEDSGYGEGRVFSTNYFKKENSKIRGYADAEMIFFIENFDPERDSESSLSELKFLTNKYKTLVEIEKIEYTIFGGKPDHNTKKAVIARFVNELDSQGYFSKDLKPSQRISLKKDFIRIRYSIEIKDQFKEMSNSDSFTYKIPPHS